VGSSQRVGGTGRRVAAAVAVAAVVGALIALAAFLALDGTGTTPNEVAQPVADGLRMPLSGMPTDDVPQRPALLVKVSNSPEARPQTGLEMADLVFEEVTEGGVTRFLAAYHSRLPEVVGPVRSARPVDVQLISGFGYPGFAYSGAREEVRSMLARAPSVTLTENGRGFFRDRGTFASHPVAPHNLFLRADEALGEVADAGARPLGDLGWAFDEQPPTSTTDAATGTTIDIPMSDSYTTSWAFDEEEGTYRRRQNGTDTEVTGGGRIAAANVVVLDVRHYLGASGYPETDVVGSGAGLVLRDGTRHAVTWSKHDDTAPLLLHHAGDDPAAFPLKPGATWIHLADSLPG
jgi:hypothetical protein